MTERFQFDGLERPVKLMAACIVGSGILSAVTLVLFSKSPLESPLKWIEVAGEFGVGLGLLATGVKIGQVKDGLWLVLKLLWGIVFLSGGSLVIWALALLTGNQPVENWSGMLFFLSSNLLFIVLALVFIRAVVRRQPRPLQTT